MERKFPAATASKTVRVEVSTTTLVLGAVAGLVGLGGLATYAFLSDRKAKQRRKLQRIMQKQIQNNFAAKHLEIIKYVQKAEWNEFDVPTIKTIYERFVKLCDSPDHGSLTRQNFRDIHVKLGVKDPQVIESLFRFWDHNHDGSVDFEELVEGLNLWCNGSRSERLQRFFRVFDLDENGSISPAELAQMFRAFYSQDSEKKIQGAVRQVFDAADRDHNHVLSLSEFKSLSTRPEFQFDPASEAFTNKFLAVFGLSAKDVREN